MKERNEKPELVIATISVSETSLFIAQIVEKKAATGITQNRLPEESYALPH